MSRETDRVLFNAGFSTIHPGRLARRAAGELIDSVRENSSAGTLVAFGFEGLHDLVAGLIANIEEQDRQLDELRMLLSAERAK